MTYIEQLRSTLTDLESKLSKAGIDDPDTYHAINNSRIVIDELEKIQSSRRIIQRQTCKDLLESMEGCYPEYHMDVVKDYMSDDV